MSASPLFDSKGDCNKDAYSLTKREYLATIAMQGILAGVNHYPDMQKHADHMAKETADYAVKMADALLAKLDKTTLKD